MTDWVAWFVAAGILVIFEVFTGTFYLLMIAVGVAAGGVAAFAGAGEFTQYVVAAVVGVVVTYALRHSRIGKFQNNDSASDPNVNMDVGQTLVVKEWKKEGSKCSARAMYRGALWDIDLAHGATAEPGEFVIREVHGSRLIVANSISSDR
jgi:membrane protein implicated in regulation of membrane protease activity